MEERLDRLAARMPLLGYALWRVLVRLWHDLPGPAYVKIALLVACLACPGPFDELALVALPRACRAWRARGERMARHEDEKR